jgi:rhodanese-related sulfurtransferase
VPAVRLTYSVTAVSEGGWYAQITYPRLRALLDGGAQLVEALPEADWEQLHLPGAISIPLRAMEAERTEVLDRARPVITYCWDGVCDLSGRAAARLATLGFEEVYDYTPSKVDWMSRGLPMEGERAGEARALRFADEDVITCAPDDTLGALRELVAHSPYPFALVLSGERVVIGRVSHDAFEGDPALRAEQVMRPGPKTYRPDEEPRKLRDSLVERELSAAILTDPEGRLLGVVARDALEQALAGRD